MKQQFFILCMILLSAGVSAQNVGIGTPNPPSRLTIVGPATSPTIPGTASTSVLRIGVSTNDGIDFGKLTTGSFSGWMQAGFNANTADPLSIQPLGGNVGIGTIVPNTSAALDVTSTTKGFLPPRMTKAQRDAVVTPAEGLMISCTDCNPEGLHQYINGSWQAMMSGSTGNYGTVVNPVTGKVWLDRNLGATQVATSSTDVLSYGHLYQWGRGADGHQLRSSGTIATQASDWLAGTGGAWNGLFITSLINWLSTAETYMWSGTAAENNPCPSGFRVPTNAEWNQERLTWTSDNALGAYTSVLKLPMAGYRTNTGSVTLVGTLGLYWSSTVTGSIARDLLFENSGAEMDGFSRVNGLSVRCIKD